jgi:hypothetical protein
MKVLHKGKFYTWTQFMTIVISTIEERNHAA